MKVSVIISFYNKIDFLKLVLAGFERQSFTDFEIIVSDDGSNETVTNALQEIIASSKITIQHIWHQDNGWRKNIILNKSVQAANGTYLIFIDGDCIPHSDFIKDHYRNRQINVALAGRRVKLSSSICSQLNPENVANGWIEKKYYTSIFKDTILGESKHFEKGIALNLPFVKNSIERKNPKRQILGCNFSIHKQDLLTINGFDERYLGPCYGEDIDIDLRFTNFGGQVKLLRYCAVQYHIHHPLLSRQSLDANEKIYNQNRNQKIGFTEFGIIKENSHN